MTLPRIKSSLPRPFAPEMNSQSEHFWAALQDGEFLLSSCNSCTKLQFPPRSHCIYCLSDDVGWTAATGKGTLYASSRIHGAGGAFAAFTPYSVGLVDLDEGVRILTRLMHDASSQPPGSALQLSVLEHSDGPLFAATSCKD